MRDFLVGLLALFVLAVSPASAQSAGSEAYPQEALDQLLAPIALYPDQLLTQILIASTYPMDVVEAADLVRLNPNLDVAILDQVLAEKNWDPSVKSLAAFPQVLTMMNDQFEWIQRLGNAFLVDQPRVMDTVQRLRQKALAAGNLRSTPQQTVILRDNLIVIEPVQSEVVYVPLYNPMLIYGPWWAPNYPPWFWYPPPIYGYSSGAVIGTGIIFGTAWLLSQNHWYWAQPGWHEHRIHLNTGNNRFWNRAEFPGAPRSMPSGTWQHSPEHRRGVAYPDAATRDRFLRVDPGAVRERQDFRGHEPGQPATDLRRPRPVATPIHSASNVTPIAPIAPIAPTPPQVERPHQRPVTPIPTPTPIRTPPLDPGVTRQQIQVHTQRGMESRRSMGDEAEALHRPSSGAHDPRRNDHPR